MLAYRAARYPAAVMQPFRDDPEEGYYVRSIGPCIDASATLADPFLMLLVIRGVSVSLIRSSRPIESAGAHGRKGREPSAVAVVPSLLRLGS
jgi:hypothetical protein